MERDDVQLIRSVLSGDDAAFSTLVQKYRKSVHALAWRKIGDFHYAEEITQDTFLQAYKKLSTLKDLNQFAGWLYVIANRLCLNWIRKKKPTMQSLDGTSTEEIEKFSYIHYVSEQRETETSERRSEIVKKLLARLPESERTVMTLYYLGEMNAKEIGKFLGVSVKTIHSRLHRARKRLQEKEELLVSDVLGGVQLPTRLTENIMQQVADLKPTPPPVGKPLIPWSAFGAAAVLIILLLGMSNQYITRFQKPYSFEAQSESTIQIIDALIVLDVDSKPAVRRQVGRAVPSSENRGIFRSTDAGLQWNLLENGLADETVYAVAAVGNTIFAGTNTGLYRLNSDVWERLPVHPSQHAILSLTVFENNLYVVTGPEPSRWKFLESSENIENITVQIHITDSPNSERVFHSIDLGASWTEITHGNESPFRSTGLDAVVLTHTGETFLPQGVVTADKNTFYKGGSFGIHRTTDGGRSWQPFMNGIMETTIQDLVTVNDRLYARTDRELVQSVDGGEVWETVEIDSGKHMLEGVEEAFSPLHFKKHGIGAIAIAARVNGTWVVSCRIADTVVLVDSEGIPEDGVYCNYGNFHDVIFVRLHAEPHPLLRLTPSIWIMPLLPLWG